MLNTQTLHTETGYLPVTPPFDFAKSLEFLGEFAPTEGEQEITADSLTKAIMISGHCIAFRVQAGDSSEQPTVKYTLFSEEPLDNSVRQAVIDRITFFLSLDDDLEPFYAIALKDECFTPIIKRLYGLHHVKFLTLCEIACWSVLTQHRPIAIARKMKQALVKRYGGSITVEGKVYWAFPEIESLIAVSREEFAALIKNERCAQYLCEVTNALSTLNEEFLRTAPYDEAEHALRKVKGIGQWSAAFILLRGLGRMERLLFNLKPFLEALPKVYGLGVTMEQLSHRYGPWFGYWGLYFRAAN
ncbi:MAG: DNA-3-methyladenine glycosylase 2 family protein [Chloroflexi bacterium]|nr:DNA-3-methyladenine glycosylase 2 family protein [Chloroflexota bacterium]